MKRVENAPSVRPSFLPLELIIYSQGKAETTFVQQHRMADLDFLEKIFLGDER